MRHAAFALLLAAAADANAACVLDLVDPSSGTTLAQVKLATGADFALAYLHSVSLRPVESRYTLRGGVIVQTAELFDDHGPGMSTEALPGERLETRRGDSGTQFVLTMARPLPRLVVRLHERPAFRLFVDGRTLALDQWHTRSVEIRPACPDHSEPQR